MFKKTAAIVFSIIVSISLLTHAVLPHHHHSGMPCFSLWENSENHSEHAGCCQQTSNTHNEGCSHTHDKNQPVNGHSCCVLEQFVIAPGSHQHWKASCSVCDSHHHTFDYVQAILFPIASLNFIPLRQGVHFRQKPYLNHSYLFFASRSIGLRAPPQYRYAA